MIDGCFKLLSDKSSEDVNEWFNLKKIWSIKLGSDQITIQ